MHLPSAQEKLARAQHWLHRASYSPEFNIVVFAALLNLPWEFLQVPFFSEMPEEKHWSAVKTCLRATVGDAVIMLMGYAIVAACFRDRHWVSHARARELLLFVSVGLVTTVIIERLALAGTWLGGWSYSGRMLIVPVVEVGITPVLQWLLLPLLTVWFVRRQIAAALPRAEGAGASAVRDGPVQVDIAADAGAEGDTSGYPHGVDQEVGVFRSYVFLLDSEERIEFLPHSVYVAVARAQAVIPRFAGKRVRLAHWQVHRVPGSAPELISEWYGWVEFDGAGAFYPTVLPGGSEAAGRSPANVDSTALPTSTERTKMKKALSAQPRQSHFR